MPQPDTLEIKHLNRGLFSDHYLETIPQTDEKWQSDTLFTRIVQVRDELQTLLATLQPENLNESQLENDWIRPVLQSLGHHFQVQINLRSRDSYLNPDYIFAANAHDAGQLTREVYQPDDIQHCLAVGDAKAWGTNLDQAKSKTERNPSQQIDDYIRYSELKWGILTDGRFWRLYERSTSKYNTYYAVDLETLLKEGTVEDFYYFYLFFQREAFLPDGWLDQALQDSITYAETLSEQLEDEVYDALVLIAQGFLNYRRNRLSANDPDTLHQIYQQSLVLLYRLLFISYAESRGILPMTDKLGNRTRYANFASLRSINLNNKDRLMRPTEVDMAKDKGAVYASLRDLFFMIDVGDEEYGISPYNGRLFSAETHPFLDHHAVGDAYLIPALDKLARIDNPNPKRSEREDKRVFVDYRDLDVRHLGAIYEKLLEYELAIAATDLALKGKKYARTSQPDKAIVRAGQVYLRTGNNERKVTGSYYTPDYIVSFIVENALQPLLTDITQQHATLTTDGTWDVRDPQALRQAILNLNVLDPATGSGHFMVEVVNQIATWLTKLNLLPDDLAHNEDELTYWKRQVVSACVYGVDVNPLAVELAKLSLWLTTIASDSPLSFLDHHVRLGNTLVGARVNQLSAWLDEQADRDDDPQQLDLFTSDTFTGGVSSAVTMMQTIEHTIASDIQHVKQQEKDYADVFDGLTPWRKLAHIWTARHFGLTLTADQWRDLYQHTLAGTPFPDDLKAIVEQAQELHEQYHFFHWDFAFPEVFFDEHGTPLPDGGFDAVVGNPPYVRQERITPYKDFFSKYYDVYSGTADLFLYFYERGLTLIRPSQRLGYVTSGTYMNSNSAKPFRQYIHENSAFETVVNFGENQPFKGAEMVYPTIAVLKKDKPAKTFKSLFVEDVYRREELGDSLNLPFADTLSEVSAMPEWRFQSIYLTNIFKKITENRSTLDEFVNHNIYYGVKTGFNDAFIIDSTIRKKLIDQHHTSSEIIKPMLRGQDLRPWYQHNNELHLIFTRQGIDIGSFPAIKSYLESYKTQLEPKPDDWQEKDWQGRKAGSYNWYEIQDNVAYSDEFEKNKIIWPDISKLPRFSMQNGAYIANTGFMIGSDSFSLLGILQSRLNWFSLTQLATPLRLRAGLWQYRVLVQYVKRLPIPDLTPAQERQLAEYAEAITTFAKDRYRLHETFRHRITDDLGHDEGKLNTKMTDWWDLADFKDFQSELKKSFKGVTIPVKERQQWEDYWRDQQAEHQRLTDEIVQREIALNAVVYEAFKLTPAEQKLIEDATQYPYGAV